MSLALFTYCAASQRGNPIGVLDVPATLLLTIASPVQAAASDM